MKKYYNDTTKEWYTQGQSMTRKVDGALFSGVPSEELLFSWGFREWIEPAPTPEQLLAKAKEEKIAELMAYDSSSAVNEFSYDGVPMWLDKATRAGLLLRFQSEKTLGETETTLWFETLSFTLQIDTAFMLLFAIEKYASACFDNTALHKKTIEQLQTKEEVEAYDFTTGYPEKPRFNT